MRPQSGDDVGRFLKYALALTQMHVEVSELSGGGGCGCSCDWLLTAAAACMRWAGARGRQRSPFHPCPPLRPTLYPSLSSLPPTDRQDRAPGDHRPGVAAPRGGTARRAPAVLRQAGELDGGPPHLLPLPAPRVWPEPQPACMPADAPFRARAFCLACSWRMTRRGGCWRPRLAASWRARTCGRSCLTSSPCPPRCEASAAAARKLERRSRGCGGARDGCGSQQRDLMMTVPLYSYLHPSVTCPAL